MIYNENLNVKLLANEQLSSKNWWMVSFCWWM